MSDLAAPFGPDGKFDEIPLTCPVCEGDPVEGKPQFSASQKKPTDQDLYDEKRGDVPTSLVGVSLEYYVCDNPECRASFCWPQPPPAFVLEPGQVAVSEADLAAIAQLQRSGLLQPGGP